MSRWAAQQVVHCQTALCQDGQSNKYPGVVHTVRQHYDKGWDIDDVVLLAQAHK